MPIHITEPHPSVDKSFYIHSGRGGAGNYHTPPSTLTPPQEAAGPPSAILLSRSNNPSSAFTSGRGGAGNVHHSKERAMFSFDEELERIKLADAPIYHVGRGGYGNSVDDRQGRSARQGSSSSMMSKDSDDSQGKKKGSKVDWVRERLGMASEKTT